jgi:glycosyltransferase involved in cell wall biosynthesis
LINHLKSEISENTKPKRVIYVWNYIEWGGAQIYFFALMKEVKKHCEVLVILPENSDKQLLTFLDNLDVKYDFFDAVSDNQPATTFKRKIQRHFNKVVCEYKTLKYLRKLDLSDSVVHIELAPWQSVTALSILAKRTKVFTTIHNNPVTNNKFRELSWKIKFAILSKFKNFNIFTSNKYTKNALYKIAPEKFISKINVTYTAVNPLEIDEALAVIIDRNELVQKYKLPEKNTLVFVVGQFIDRKGRWVLLDAAKKITEIDNEIGFVWISNSKPSVEDLQKTENYGLGDNFRLITSDQVGKERIDLFKLMRMADIFALPSYIEGLPISLLEGMALGKPSISTNVYAIPEAVKHLETGILIEPGDSSALAEAILQLKNNKELSEKIGKSGREFVLKNFDEREAAKIAFQTYKESCV